MRNALRWMLIVGLATVLAWSGLAKVADPAALASAIQGFRLVDERVAWVLAHYVPWLELVLAAALLTKRWRAGALVLAGALFTVFAIAWLLAWGRGLNVSCGCFGGEGHGGTGSTVIGALRALALATIAWGCLMEWMSKGGTATGRS